MAKHIIYGAPGTGKTTKLMNILEEILNKGIPPEDVCFCSFSKAAANEAISRAMFNFNFEKKDLNYFGTIHSLCFRRFCSDKKVMKQSDKKKFFDEIGIDYQIVKDDEDLLTGESSFDYNGNIILNFYDKLRLYYCNRITKFSSKQLPSLFHNLPTLNQDDYTKLFGNVFDLYDVLMKFENYKNKNNLIDFIDMLIYVLENDWVIPTKILIVDEFQDLSPLQYKIYELWKKNKEDVYIAGDDDQCLFSDTKIITDRGIKKIKDITRKDKVLSNFGAGKLKLVDVKEVKKQPCIRKCLLIHTKTGKKIKCTENHHFFATMTKKNKLLGWYVYLMRRNDGAFRIGISKNPAIRKNFERNLSGIYPILFFNELSKALFYEEYLSIKYHISKKTFYPRTNIDKKNIKIFELLKKIQNINGILKEVNKSLEDSIWIKPICRGKTNRKIINLCCLYANRKERKSPYFNVYFKNKNKRIRYDFNNYKEATIKAKELSKLYDTRISERWSFDSNNKNNKFFKIKAMNLIQGMSIPCLSKDKIVYEEIKSIEKIKSPKYVYDIEVDGTHNYCANNIFVSNTIYRFICADSNFLLKERLSINKNNGDEEVILPKTYRLPKEVYKYCQSYIINHIKNERINKSVSSIKSGGEVIEDYIYGDLSKALTYLRKDKKTFILFRTNYYKKTFISEVLVPAGLVYNEIRGYSIWNSRTINLFNASIKLINKKEINYEELKYLIENIPFRYGLLKRGLKSRFKDMKKSDSYNLSDLIKIGFDLKFFKMLDYDRLYTIFDLKENIRKSFKCAKKELIKYPINIWIGTIHSSKGKEADDVIIFKDISNRIVNELTKSNKGWDDEIRVFYVGMSRSKERLIILRGGFKNADSEIIP